jgi:hypothetical protein
LLQFARTIERIMGRTDLIAVAPGALQKLKRYLNRQRLQRIAELCIGLLLAWLVALAVARAAAFGVVVISLAAVWLAAVLLERRWAPARGPLAPVGRIARRYGAVLAVAAPVLLAAGAAAGLHDAAGRAALEAQAEKNRSRAEKQERLAAKREAEKRRLHRLKADRLAEQMESTMSESRWRDAHRIYLELQALNPAHGSLQVAWAKLGPELDALRESERLTAVAAGVRQARKTVKDRVMCESARTVSESWSRLRQVRPEDPQWSDAVKAAERLDRCRQRLVKVFSQNAIALRVQARNEFSRAARLELQKSGYAPRIRLSGEKKRVMTTTVSDMSEQDAARITADGSREPGTLLQRAQRIGFERVALSNGTGKTWTYKLDPADESRLGLVVLKKFGLDRPLRLEEPAEGSAAAAQ